ncbi:hypothetical protein BDQ12DRAFT_298658 [Crucibulum laeve]|uniref:Uncharacterized protein n=1 Tax=Crucibulum laeve TaxID=68775 RepID=A0A5C3MER5_9AGAR|nr:hypothetical protein BDQ12DRAFT_298658 [Crucibulum laeve]
MSTSSSLVTTPASEAPPGMIISTNPHHQPSTQPRQSLKRRKSLRLPSQPPPIPIPPSLLQSPYLNSPQSIFKRDLSAPRMPSQEDEQWLQDTIPMPSHGTEVEPDRSQERKDAAPQVTRWSVGSGARATEEAAKCEGTYPPTRGRCPKPKPRSSFHATAPPSPPLIHWRQMPSRFASRPQWLTEGQTRSEPDITRPLEHSYFSSVAPLR